MKKRVLIAEVDAKARIFLESACANFDAECETVTDDESAYRRFLEFGPDVIFVDALFPRRGAFDLIRRLRQAEGGDQLLLFVTCGLAGGGGSLRDEALRTWGARGFLTKPFAEAKLMADLAPLLKAAAPPPEPPPPPSPAPPPPSAAPAEEKTPVAAAPEFSETGDFDRRELSMLLGRLSRAGRAVVVLGSGKARKALYVEGGQIVFARSNLFSETLARHFLDKEEVSEEQYRQAISDVLQTGRKIGEAFVAMGAVKPERVAEAVRENIWDKINDLFTWRRGWYKVGEWAEPPAELPGGPIDLFEVLWRAGVQEMTMTQAAESLRPLAERVLVVTGDPESLVEKGFLGPHGVAMAGLAERVNEKRVDEACEVAGAKRLQELFFLLASGILGLTGGESAPPISAETRARADLVGRKLAWMRSRNYFQILGVNLDCADDEVRRAHSALKAEFDPGRMEPDAPPEMGRALHEASEIAARAFEALSTADKRAIYVDSLRHGGEVPMAQAERQLRAEASYREGLMALKRGRVDEAIDKFGWAADLNPDEADYLVQLALARMRREGGDVKKDLDAAEAALRRAVDAAPQHAEPLYQMGRVCLLRKLPQDAATWFERALQCDPRHKGAAQELKELRKGTLGKLPFFGRRS